VYEIVTLHFFYPFYCVSYSVAESGSIHLSS